MKKVVMSLFVVMLSGLVFSAIAQEKKAAPSAVLQPEGCVQVEVDYDLTPADMAKGYDWSSLLIKDGGFDAKPRGKGKVKREVCWFKPDHSPSAWEVRKMIEDSGEYMVADLWELNALGTAKPDLQRRLWLVGLGSQWGRNSFGEMGIPFLLERDGKRELSLFWDFVRVGWRSSICRFVAIRK